MYFWLVAKLGTGLARTFGLSARSSAKIRTSLARSPGD